MLKAKFKQFIQNAYNHQLIPLWGMLLPNVPFVSVRFSETEKELERAFTNLILASKFHPDFLTVCAERFKLTPRDEDIRKIEKRRKNLNLKQLLW
jgi:hypothetical protein